MVAITLGFWTIVPSQAARPVASTSTDSLWSLRSWQRQTQVEQQAGVINPTSPPPGCVWDADDYQLVGFVGPLAVGESQSITLCEIADWQPHVAWIATATDGVTVEMQVGPTVSSGSLNACIQGPQYDHQTTLLPPVEGSNGGVGLLTDVTFTVTNTSGRKIHKVSVEGALMDNTGQPLGGCVLGARYGYDPAWMVGAG